MSLIPLTAFTAGEISPLMHSRIDLDLYQYACKDLTNFIPLQYGSLLKRPGLKLASNNANALDLPSRRRRLIPFIISTSQVFLFSICDTGTSSGIVVNIYTPSTDNFDNPRLTVFQTVALTGITYDAVIDMQYAQNGSTIIFVHTSFQPFQLVYDGLRFNYEIINFTQPATIGSAPEVRYVWLGDEAEQPETPQTYTYGYTYLYEDGTETAMSSTTTATGTAVLDYLSLMRITVNIRTGEQPQSQVIKIYRMVNGIPSYVGRARNINPLSALFVFDDNGTYTPDASHNPPTYTDTFNSSGNYPGCVTWYNERLVLGGTLNEPNTFWGSMVGNYTNFAEYQTPSAITPYKYQLQSDRLNAIRWLKASRDLLIGTSAGEWSLSNVRADQPYTGREYTSIGSTYLQPLSINQSLIFLNKTGRSCFSFAFNYRVNGYYAVDLNIFAEHLTRDRSVIAFAYAAEPYNLLVCVCDDGTALYCVYNPDYEITAWGKFDIHGLVRDVISVPSPTQDDIYLVIEDQYWNGTAYATGWTIHKLDQEFISNNPADAFFVDEGIRWGTTSGTSTSFIIDLQSYPALNLNDMIIIADGRITDFTVISVSGWTVSFRLDGPAASRISIGYPYTSTIESMEIEGGSQDGQVSASRDRVIKNIRIRFDRTKGGQIAVGSIDDSVLPEFSDIKFGSTNYEGKIPLFSGYKDVNISKGRSMTPTVIVQQVLPFPMTITGMIVEVVSPQGR